MSNESGNAAIHFVDRHLHTGNADKKAFIETDGRQRSLTYRELSTDASRMGDLFCQHGIRREERVALLMLDEIEWPVIFWGSLKSGVIPVALNTLLSTSVYESILADCRASALFVSAALLPAVEPLLENHPSIRHVFVTGSEDTSHISFEKALSDCTETATYAASADECAFWLYSSGSTGQPKGVRHIHSSLKFTADTYGKQVLGIDKDDVVYSAAKFFFAYGLGNAMTFPMSVGATTLLLSGRPTPPVVLELFNTHKPTVFCGVPTLYAAVTAELDTGKSIGAAKLRRCISAGEALPSEVGKSWEKLTGCEVLDGVGSTEMLHIFLSNRSGDVVYGTSGTAVPGYQLRLVNEEGDEVAVGEIGELLVDGASAATDYWNQREKSRHTFEGVWTRTGDKYEKRPDGRLEYCSRTDDMFKVSGIWVSPFEVEQALSSHIDVLEAAVVPMRDDKGLEKPKAFVVLQQGAKTTDAAQVESLLKEHVKEQVGKWKYPRWIELVDDLPKTATGKIQRFKLRE